jgi:toxin ParE1/3/4
MYTLFIKPLAEADATEAANWYNSKRVGLGEEFLLALEAEINAISRNPHQFNVVYNHIRRALIGRFPYGVFFIIENEKVHVLAIIHNHRNPKVWKKRR